ncbi:MAG: hypothetical protein GX131_10335 [candidate division WS1 bacterium]|nr:hypothetical protein [candidate division WS1 bacterium]
MLIGCQTMSPTGSPLSPTGTADGEETAALTEQERQELVRETLKELGLDDIQTLKTKIARLEAQERAKAGPPALAKDMWPTKRVLSDAIQAARTQKATEVGAALERLEPLVATVTADLPANMISVHCERALAYLSSNELNEAAEELAQAYDVAHESKFATLVPAGVEDMIQTNARSQVAAARPQEAATVVQTVLQKCRAHESMATMKRIAQGVVGAREALDRGAWPVVEAELFEVHRELTDFDSRLQTERWLLDEDEATATGSATAGAAAPETPTNAEGATEGAAAPTGEAAAGAETPQNAGGATGPAATPAPGAGTAPQPTR